MRLGQKNPKIVIAVLSVTIPLEHGRSLMAMTSSQASRLSAQGSIGVLKRYGTLSLSLFGCISSAGGWLDGRDQWGSEELGYSPFGCISWGGGWVDCGVQWGSQEIGYSLFGCISSAGGWLDGRDQWGSQEVGYSLFGCISSAGGWLDGRDQWGSQEVGYSLFGCISSAGRWVDGPEGSMGQNGRCPIDLLTHCVTFSRYYCNATLGQGLE